MQVATPACSGNGTTGVGREIEVIALELPGRGLHSRAPLIDSMSTMIERLLPVLDPRRDKPFALFGHSMGALISFELSRALKVSGRKVRAASFCLRHAPTAPLGWTQDPYFA